ncbi:DUF2975 domain-containing protein [Saccharopolyspora sp. NPDC002376]
MLGMLLAGLFGVLFPLLGVTGLLPATNIREVQLTEPAHLPAPPGAVTLRGTNHAELVFAVPGFADRLLLALPDLVDSLLLLAILAILLRIARTFRAGEPFAAANATRLMVIAMAVVLQGLLVPLTDMITTDLLVSGTPSADAVQIGTSFQSGPVFLGLLIAAAAAAFRNGTSLRADTEGLV